MKKLFFGFTAFFSLLLTNSSIFAFRAVYKVPVEYVIREKIAIYIVPTILLLIFTLILKRFVKNKKIMNISLLILSVILALLAIVCIILTLKVKLFN